MKLIVAKAELFIPQLPPSTSHGFEVNCDAGARLKLAHQKNESMPWKGNV